MAKYAISPQGVQSFQTLAESLSSSMDNIKTANKSLQTSMESVMETTGIYGLEIWNITLKIGTTLSDGEDSVNTLITAINKQAGEIEALFSLGGEDSKSGNGSSSTPGKAGESSGRGLPHTNQTYNTVTIEGQTVKIFDHPHDVAAKGVINQGTNDLGLRGDCGLCASGSFMNLAGNHFSENDIAKYAKGKGLCDKDGGTNANNRASIITGMSGIPVDIVQGKSINDLVSYVENGQGVMIGVEASLYKPEWYGEYDPNDPGGHSMLLASVIRDPNTNNIMKYVVIDSNGNDPRDACQLVDPAVLQRAFSFWGSTAEISKTVLF